MNPITKLKEHRVKIVDIGASGGIDKRWEMINMNHLSILFEPDARAFGELVKKKSR